VNRRAKYGDLGCAPAEWPRLGGTVVAAAIPIVTGSHRGDAVCIGCPPGDPTVLQPALNGSFIDAIRAHYKTVHPEKELR